MFIFQNIHSVLGVINDQTSLLIYSPDELQGLKYQKTLYFGVKRLDYGSWRNFMQVFKAIEIILLI